MKINNLYTSIAVNRTPSALDWGTNNLICYGAANSIAILDPNYDDSCKIIKTYAIHTGRVNATKWIRRKSGEDEYEVISGSDDSLCIYLNIKDKDNPQKLILKGHTDSVTSIDSIYLNEELTIVTASADSSIRLWRIEKDFDWNQESLECFQVIDLKTGICFDVKFCQLYDAGILLAFAADDDKVKFYGENSQKCFEKVEELTGHEDWVRSLDFTSDVNGDILLASSSQDSFIRLWKITPFINNKKLNSFVIDSIQIEERNFKLADKKFTLALESVLQGHEGWVYSVHWNNTNSLQLLSCSMDRTMIVWTLDQELNVWVEKVRVGDVGGNTLGFYGGRFNSKGNSLVGHGFQGSLHLWHQNSNDDRLWEPGVISSGHFREVRDIKWEPQGEFLFSVSMDQTTRLHSSWKRDDKKVSYHEIARPQVHGYDMQCIAVLSRYKFASAAEEKIIRTFQAPANFVENFRNLTKVDSDQEGDTILKSNQKGASVPSLGLSNKIVYEEDLTNTVKEDKKFKDEYPENYFVPMQMTVPPTEEYLTQNTLWPELQKLYAHGYELYSLTSNANGTILASSCKATTLEHAEIILWNPGTWKIFQRLRFHKLTVTQMKFSSDGNRLLAVSRDRRWSLFENTPEGDNAINFQLAASSDKSNGVHERIIWSCDWSHDDKYFATGSRDGKVAVWIKSDVDSETSLKNYSCSASVNLPGESITTLSFARSHWMDKSYLLAIGLESGIIHLYNFTGDSCEAIASLNNSEAHHLSVNKLEFRPSINEYHLASCGNDNLVRIFEINK